VRTGAVQSKHAQVELYEMYWADLSRVTAGVTRIGAELFTFLFLLSQIGTNALALAALTEPRLAWATRVQRWCNWSFSRLLAPLALQLVVFALLLLPAVLFSGRDQQLAQCTTPPAAGAVAVAIVALVVARSLVLRLRPRASLVAWAVLGSAGAAALVVQYRDSSYGLAILMGVWIALLFVSYLALLLYCEERFRGVLVSGIGVVDHLRGRVARATADANL
jgi:hypothetical protein